MTMTLADGFKMLKRADCIDLPPKQRMYFWYGHEQALLIDKVKPSTSDIAKALGNRPPKTPHCFGRVGLYSAAENARELRLLVAGAVPSKLVKDFRTEAANHGLRGIEVVVGEGADDDEDKGTDKAPEVAIPSDKPAPTGKVDPAAQLLLQRLQDLMPDFKKAQGSPVAGAKLVELIQKAKKHIDAKDYAKASTDIDNLVTLIRLALKHASASTGAQQSTNDGKSEIPTQPAKIDPAAHEEFAAEVRKQKNTARATRLGQVLDGVKSEKYFPQGMSAQYAKEGLKPGKEFQLFLTALKNFEDKYAFRRELMQKNQGSPVDFTPYEHDLEEMIGLTRAYLDHHAKDLTEAQQKSSESQRKKQICTATLLMLQQTKLKVEFESLGKPEAWDLKKENQAAALYAKVLFEEGNAPAQKLPPGDSGVSGAWWVEALDFADPKLKNKKKKFIFKPADAEAQIPGFPKGGSAPREVVSKVAIDKIQSATGLDFNFPETALVAIDDGKLADPDKDPNAPPTSGPRMGSMQHFNKSGKPLNVQRRLDPDLPKRIPKEEVQKTAVMDLITLNLDRHGGNFLVDQTPGSDGKSTPKLIPIDHGLTLPSREGLDARRGKLHENAVNTMPASREKFTPEMIAKIQQIDADAVVQGMKDSMKALKELHPDQPLEKMVPDANFELTRRSIQFMQKAAAELSVDELFDAYAINAEDIFDSPPGEQQKAFAKAIKEAKDRSAARRELIELAEDETQSKKLKITVQGLGWVVELAVGDFARWCAMNPTRVMNIYKYHLENPPMRVELDSMLEQLGPETPIAAKIRRQTLRDGHDAATTEIRKQGKAKPAAAATKVPADGVVKAMKEMEQELPGTRPDDPNQQSALAALWVEYRQLGGFHEFCRLGGSAEIPTLKDRLNTLKVLKANASALAAIDKLGPVHQQENLESRRALHLSVALDGLGRIRDESVSAPIKEWFDKARVAMDLGKLDESDNALAEAEKLLDIALNRIDRKEDEFAGRHEVVLDTINVVPQATPLHRKLMVDYRESLRRADEQDFDGCEKILKRLEGEAEKAAALATKA